MPATLFLRTQRRVLKKNLMPDGQPCKSHRENPAAVIRVAVGGHTLTVWGSPVGPILEREHTYEVNKTCNCPSFDL